MIFVQEGGDKGVGKLGKLSGGQFHLVKLPIGELALDDTLNSVGELVAEIGLRGLFLVYEELFVMRGDFLLGGIRMSLLHFLHCADKMLCFAFAVALGAGEGARGCLAGVGEHDECDFTRGGRLLVISEARLIGGRASLFGGLPTGLVVEGGHDGIAVMLEDGWIYQAGEVVLACQPNAEARVFAQIFAAVLRGMPQMRTDDLPGRAGLF